MKYVISLLISSIWLSGWCQENITISGTVKDKESGEALIFATVYLKGSTEGATTNEYGFYSLTIPNKPGTIEVSYMGYEVGSLPIEPGKNQTLNFGLTNTAQTLKTFEIVAEKSQQEEELNSTQMSAIKIPTKQVTAIPSIGGETDVIKVMQLMPGVSRGSEGGTSMFVRGGDADQNLVLLDESTVYNVGHLFGFFSVFNPDVIKDMTMIKGAFPANYGGRLSSVLDLRMKEGHANKFHGQGGIGLLSSRLTLEGPIRKEKASFLISGRRTYIDQVFKLAGSNIPYYFYDINAKMNYSFSDKDRIYFSSYFGQDVLKVNEAVEEEPDSTAQDTTTGQSQVGVLDFGFNLGNFTQTLRWNHIYSNKLFSNLSLIHTNFNYDIQGSFLEHSVLIRSKIRDLGGKLDFDFYRTSESHIKYGLLFVNHNFRPNVVSATGVISEILDDQTGDRIDTQEMAMYGSIDQSLMKDILKTNLGLRVSGTNVQSQFYYGIEPRFGARYTLTKEDALKVSYSRMYQYMHRVSSSTIALPTDLWYPVTAAVKPQYADQVAVGYNHLFKKIGTAVTLEGYYKWLYNLIEYREGANLILNSNFEEELLQGTGDAWGAELLIKKDEGLLTGWIGYTVSWATRDFDELNNGKTFWAKYDRRHNASVVATYMLSERWKVSAVWVYSTGARFTAQTGQYFQPNASLTDVDVIPIFSDRNSIKMSPSHRLDINFILRSKPEKKFKSEWHFGAYNVYNRATPYRINIVPAENGGYKYTQPGLFGFIPSIAYNFEF